MSFASKLAQVDVTLRDVLGESVTYTPGEGDAVEVDGIFDAAFQKVDAGQAGVTSTEPAVFLALDDLPTDPETDLDATVTVDEVTYTIREVQKSGQSVTLLLHRQ